MPEKKTVERARRDAREGKSTSTQAGELVREEIHHVREGKHGARSPKQAIAIGLSKARRAGVALPAPKKGRTSAKTRRSAERDVEMGQGGRKPRSPSARRSRAVKGALKREGRKAASKEALSEQARGAAEERREHGAKTPSTRKRRTPARKRPTKTASGERRAATPRRASTKRTTAKRASRAPRAKGSARTRRKGGAERAKR